MSARKTVRQAVRTALLGGPCMDFTSLPAWAQSIEADALPAFTVSTLSERSQKVSKEGDLRRQIGLAVVIKTLGHDTIEDELDDVADNIEAAVDAAVLALPETTACELSETRIDMSGEGKARAATLVLTWRVTVTTDPV